MASEDMATISGDGEVYTVKGAIKLIQTQKKQIDFLLTLAKQLIDSPDQGGVLDSRLQELHQSISQSSVDNGLTGEKAIEICRVMGISSVLDAHSAVSSKEALLSEVETLKLQVQEAGIVD